MLYRKVPKTGGALSILGFGAMRLPEKDGVIDKEKATELIHRAVDSGINYIDTAWPYHNEQSETFVGEALQGGYREKVRIATKMPQWLVEDREDMDRFLAIQMEKLRTNHIEYYLVHALTADRFGPLFSMGLAEFLDTAKSDGRISYAGFSFHDTIETFREIIDVYNWDFCQIQYNYLDEKIQAGTEGLKYAVGKGIAVMVMEPLRGGSLVTGIPREVSAIMDESEIKRTPAEWGIRWVWNHPEVTIVLSGMSDITQLDENILTASDAYPGSMTGKELAVIDRIAKKYRELMKIPCTGCRYCMPCPYGIDIPGCFDLYNSSNIFPDKGRYSYRYLYISHHLVLQKSGASLCRNCGLCEKHCPQHIEIRKNLKIIGDEFEGNATRLAVPLLNVLRKVKRRVPGITLLLRKMNSRR